MSAKRIMVFSHVKQSVFETMFPNFYLWADSANSPDVYCFVKWDGLETPISVLETELIEYWKTKGIDTNAPEIPMQYAIAEIAIKKYKAAK